MSWHRVGTVTVTNGVATVAGAGTSWFSVIAGGWAFRGPDGRVYEIQSVASDTSLTLAEPYLGTTASGQPYAAYPTQGETRSLAQRISALISSYAAYLNTTLIGRFGAGTVSAPGVAREGDTNTGIFWPADDTVAVSTAGVQRMSCNPSGNFVFGAPGAESSNRVHINPVGGNGAGLHVGTLEQGLTLWHSTGNDPALIYGSASTLRFGTQTGFGAAGFVERMRIDASGGVGIGTSVVPAGRRLAVAGGSVRLDNDAQIEFGGSTAGFYGNSGGNTLIWFTNTTERMRIDAGGNVGFGNSNFAYATGGRTVVGINGSGSSLLELQSGGLGRGYLTGNPTNVELGAVGFINFVTGAAPAVRFRIDAEGHSLFLNQPFTAPVLSNGWFSIAPSSNTNARIYYRGTDGVLRTGNIPLS